MSTINKDEIEKFSKLAEEWWDIKGKFKPLHMFNPIRIEYILETCKSYFKIKDETKLTKICLSRFINRYAYVHL